jgi:glycosyltransferase involved in cell wall biosynthesis
MPAVSIVAPAYNEEDTLAEFHRRVSAAMDGEDYELLIVDDGSTDRTAELLVELASEDPRLRPLRLSRNFGHQAALTAGIDQAAGQAVVTIDADLQDPPEVIAQVLERWRGGADVVHTVRAVRPGEARWRLLAIRAFYRAFGRVSGLETYPGNSGDFRLIAGPALDALRAMPERNRFLRGLISWVGFEQATVAYEREERFAGTSKYPLRKLLSLAADGVFSFTAAPLRLAAGLGALFSAIAFFAIPVIIVLKLTGVYSVSGTASIHILVLLVGGVQLVFLGVVGEYLARAYDEGKQRPIYLLRPTEPAPRPPRGGASTPRASDERDG